LPHPALGALLPALSQGWVDKSTHSKPYITLFGVCMVKSEHFARKYVGNPWEARENAGRECCGNGGGCVEKRLAILTTTAGFKALD